MMTKERKITIITNLLEQLWDDAFKAGKASVYAPTTELVLTKDRAPSWNGMLDMESLPKVDPTTAGQVVTMMLKQTDFIPPHDAEEKQDMTPDIPNKSLTDRKMFVGVKLQQGSTVSREFLQGALKALSDPDVRDQIVLDHDQGQREKIAELEKKVQDYEEHYVHQDLLFKEQDRSCELKQLNEALEQQTAQLKKTLTDAQTQLENMIHAAWERAEMADAFDDKEW